MKNIRYFINRLGALQIAIVLLLVGVFLGILVSNVFSSSYLEQMVYLESNVFKSIALNKIDYFGLFMFTLKQNLKQLLIFWLLSITILGIPYMIIKIVAFGFSASFFISVVTMNYGLKGMLLVFAYIIPHGLIYLPVALLNLYKGFNLCKTIYFNKTNHVNSIFSLLKPYFAVILLLIIALAIGSFLEAYIGSFFLKKTLALFS